MKERQKRRKDEKKRKRHEAMLRREREKTKEIHCGKEIDKEILLNNCQSHLHPHLHLTLMSIITN